MTLSVDWDRYWNELHVRHGSDRAADPQALQAVLRPDMPWLFNRAVDYFQRMHMARAFDRLAPWTGRAALEVGCGGGRWCRELARRGAQVTGVDHSAHAIEQNRAVYAGLPIRFETMSADRLALPDAAFDAVLTVTVLQHVPYESQLAAAREIARVLKPGGRLLTVELADDRLADGAHTRTGDAFPHNSAGWRTLHESAGLTWTYSHRHAYVPLTTTTIGTARAWFEAQVRRRPPAPPAPAPAGETAPSSATSPAALPPRPRWLHRANDAFWDAATVACLFATFPIEWIANRWFERANSHHLMIFEKPHA